jgi:membrane protein EpsK
LTTTNQVTEKPTEKAADPAVSTEEAKRNLAKNMTSQIALFVFSAATSLYFVKYQITNLGIANYGTVSLASQVVAWANVISIAVVGTIGRFVTLALAKGDDKQARSYFSSQFIAIIWLSLLLIPVAGIISYLTPTLFKIPFGQEKNTQILFFLTYLTFIVTLFAGALQVATYVKQRLDIKNGLDALNQTVGYILWIVLFAWLSPSLWQIGFGRLIGALIALIGTAYAFKRLTPQIIPSLQGFDRRKFEETIKMGGWMTIGRAGGMLYVCFDAVIINVMLGPSSVGRYMSVAGLCAMLKVFTWLAWSIMGPPAIAYASREDWAGLLRATSRAVKFLSLSMGVIMGLVCGLSAPFLTVWLGPSFTSLSLLVWLMFSHLVLNQGMDHLFAVNYATNRMAVPSIVTIAGGVLKVVLAIIFIKYTDWGFYGVAVADFVANSLRNLVFAPLYAGRLLRSSCWPLYRAVLPSIIVFAGTSAVAWGLTQASALTTLPRLAASGFVISAMSALAVYFVILNKDDKAFIKQLMPRIPQKETTADG